MQDKDLSNQNNDILIKYENFENLRAYLFNLQYLKHFIKKKGKLTDLDMTNQILEKSDEIKNSDYNIQKYAEDIFTIKNLMDIDKLLEEQEKYIYTTILSDLKRINSNIVNILSLLYKDQLGSVFLDEKVAVDLDAFNKTHKNLKLLLESINDDKNAEQNIRLVAKYKILAGIFNKQLIELQEIWQ